MRCYADSSFIVKLISFEPDTESAIAEFRRLECPRLPLLALHELEIRNAILHKAWHQQQSLPSRERAHIEREKQTARKDGTHGSARLISKNLARLGEYFERA